MANFSRHILVSCHAVDEEDMTILMNGMAVHSDFINWRLNEFHDACVGLGDDDPEEPKLKIWHGFARADFPWSVLSGLITSVSWKKEETIMIQVEDEEGLTRYSAREFCNNVSGGKIK